MEIAILFDKTSEALKRDADILSQAFKAVAAGKIRLRYVDPLEPPVSVDLCIHLDTPIYVWMPWSTVSVLLVNPERYEMNEWSGYVPHFDGFLFKSRAAQERFQAVNPTAKTWLLHWSTFFRETGKLPQSHSSKDGFLTFIETEVQKKATMHMISLWKDSYPKLSVYSRKGFDVPVREAANIVYKELPENQDQRHALLAFYPGALCVSEEDTFNYRAVEAQNYGAFLILNTADQNGEYFNNNSNIQWIPCAKQEKLLGYSCSFSQEENEMYQDCLDQAMENFEKADLKSVRQLQKTAGKIRWELFLEKRFPEVWKSLQEIVAEKKPMKAKHLPPVLQPNDCPPISIVSLLYNRRKFFDLACHNIMLSDYPKNKIEWVIVEDSDDPNEDASDRVVQVGLKAAPLTVVYIPLEKKTPIGQKRNIGIERAKNDIILFMDDDDHYPETSFRRRVSWLTKHPWGPKAVGCTTIACYDLIRGVSSVNTPPWNLSLGKRISEATLTFYKSWWAEKKFSAENISEGEGFLEGREQDVLELPPQQVIVAFSHSKNTSGRRVPSGDIKPGCFWGFPKEYLIYIHKIVGMEIEEER